ncbi:unnamed protein product [Caenorhabditis brenneri]
MDAPPDTPPLPQLNNINDLIGGVLMLHERAQNDPEFRRLMATYPEKEIIDTRIPFRGTDRDFELLVNCLVEGQENEKEVAELRRALEVEKRLNASRTVAPTSFSYTYSPIFVPHGPGTGPPMYAPTDPLSMYYPTMTPNTEPASQIEDTGIHGLFQRLNWPGSNVPSTSTAVVTAPYFSQLQPIQEPQVPKEETLNLQDEMAYMDQQIDTMAKHHEQEMLNLKLDRLVENRHWEDRIAQIKEDNEKLEGYCASAELAKAEVEETLEKKEERLRRQVEQQSVKDWQMHEFKLKMEEKDRKIQELEERLSSMESSTSNELEQLRTQLSKMVMDPTEKRKKPRISESQPSSSEGNGGVTDGWSKVDDSGDVWVYGEEQDA